MTVTPNTTITLDGTPSSADTTAWAWTAIQQPAASAGAVYEAFFDPLDPGLGGFPDDPTTASAVFWADQAGRYVFSLAVSDVDGNVAPTAACPAHAHVVVEAGAAAPVRAVGAFCDRSGFTDRCVAPTHCRQTGAAGVGQCLEVWPLFAETEPNETSANAIPTSLGPDGAFLGSIDPCNGDNYDVYALTLPADRRVVVETSDANGTCSGDTRLYRVDPAVLDTAGRAGAIVAALASDDSSGTGECSRIEEDLTAGVHYFLVDEDGDDYALSYTLRVVPVSASGDLCDVHLVESHCEAGTSCVDANLDGDGACAP